MPPPRASSRPGQNPRRSNRARLFPAGFLDIRKGPQATSANAHNRILMPAAALLASDIGSSRHGQFYGLSGEQGCDIGVGERPSQPHNVSAVEAIGL